MKLRALRLSNVRRFTDPVDITGFGDGLNLLTAPNEAGKSTIFAALNALFFLKARSWDKVARGLQPYAGGDPQVSAEIETPEGLFTVSKTWSSAAGRKDVRVTQGARLVAQSDAAERWIADLMRGPGDGGPAGLLWVRQGLVALDEDSAGANVRRGVLSSVTGEVEAMTGGRRMDKALARVEADLSVYVTSRGARRGGPLDQVDTALEELRAQEAELSEKARSLRAALDRRRAVRHELKQLEDPAEAAARRAQLQGAEDALGAAERHADRVATARAEAERATALRMATDRQIETLTEALAERDTAARLLATAQTESAQAEQAVDGAAAAAAEAEAAADAARADQGRAMAALRRVEQAEAAGTAQALRTELSAQITRGVAQEQALAEAEQAAGHGPDAKTMTRLEALRDTVRAADLARKAAAPVIRVRYSGAVARVRLDGTAVPEGARLPVPDPTEFEIDGVGWVTVEPGARADTATLAQARDALADALQAAGFVTLDAARQAAQGRSLAQSRHSALAQAFAAEFPQGLAPLRARLAALPEAPQPDPDLPSRAEADAALAAVQSVFATATGTAKAAQSALAEARRSADRWSEKCASAQDRLDRASAALSRHPDPAAALSEAQARRAQEHLAEEAALARRATLERDAPDLQAAELRVSRLRAAAAQARDTLAALREELAGLEGHIRSSAETGIDEELADVIRQRMYAEARRDAIMFEVAVLERLRDALTRSRAQARDTYVAPVKAELRPLLAQFMPGADLALDAEAVLPSELTRDGQPEPVEGLSGGTREQLALLVRLAFARLLAKAGRAAPVILDDAIVFTDDERIERMFDALTHQARDLQIIVFSCRQNAFRTLPAHILTLGPAAPQ